jgi:ribosome biogenesis protein NSA2
MELFKKRQGRRLNHEERMRKKEAREVHKTSKLAKGLHGIKGKLLSKKRYKEKAAMKKQIKAHEEKKGEIKSTKDTSSAIPEYLLERTKTKERKMLSNMIKEKRKEKAGKWKVPISKVKSVAEDEIMKVIKTGKRKRKEWKRMITKATFVGENFTRKPPKMERFIRPTGMRFKKAHVTHPELKTTFYLSILGVKRNPHSPLYTSLGVITKGSIIEVNVSELGLVTQTGKVVWGKYAQVTNNPENDGCINAVLLV